MKKLLIPFVLLTFSVSLVGEALARGRSGGFSSGRSSWGSSSRSSWGSSSRSSWGSSSRSSTSRSSSWNTRRSSTTNTKRSTAAKPTRSKADQKLYNKAKASGTAFKSKTAATKDFKAKHASKYTSKYATKPTTRPSHIPQTTKVGNTTYNVTYNQQYGGYGYLGPGGSWIMYDAMRDAAMLSVLMSNRGYYYDRPVSSGPVVVHDGGWGFFAWMGVFVIIVFVIAAVMIGISNN